MQGGQIRTEAILIPNLSHLFWLLQIYVHRTNLIFSTLILPAYPINLSENERQTFEKSFCKMGWRHFRKLSLVATNVVEVFVTFEKKKCLALKNLNLCKSVNPDDTHLWKLTDEFTKWLNNCFWKSMDWKQTAVK